MQNQLPDIDPLHYHALQDTNNALKLEIQRLSLIEQNFKTLEQKVCLESLKCIV